MTGNDKMTNLVAQVTASDSTPLRVRCILEGVGRNVNADHCFVYVLREPGGSVYDNLYEWCAEGIPSIIDAQQGIDLTGYPDLYDSFHNGRLWSFTDVDKLHSSMRDWAKMHGIQSLISAPFRDRDDVVAGYVGFDFVRTHPKPIPANALRNLMEAVNMISFCLNAKREQDRATYAAGILQEMGVGIWSFELDDGAPPRMYGNKAMDDLLGCDGSTLTPEEYYHAWYDHIHPDHYAQVHDTVKNLMDGRHAEVQYPFLHPARGEMWVRCGGRRDMTYTSGVRIIGRHQDVSELLHVQRDSAEEVGAVQRLADYERERADKERDINSALELLVTERDFTRVLSRLMALWCRALGAQWSVLGEFAGGGFQVVHSHAAEGGAPLFEPGAHLAYLPELSGEAKGGGEDGDFISVLDLQESEAVREMAKMARDAKVVRGIASCHSHIIRFKGARWGSIVLFFRARHAFTEDERRFIAISAHGVELALLRRGYETR